MIWQRELAKILYPKIFTDLDDAREKRDLHAVSISSLNKEVQGKNNTIEYLSKQLQDQSIQINELVNNSNSTELELYCNTHYTEVSKFAYKDKGIYGEHRFSMYPNELIQPRLYLINKIRKELKLGTYSNIYSKAKVIGKYVDNKLKWTSDKTTTGSIDAFQSIIDVLFNNKQDCENHAGLVSSIEPEFGIAFGFCGKTGHAFNVFVYNNELYVIETNKTYDINNSFKIFKYSEQTEYVIHLIFTEDKTFECVDNPGKFGVKQY